MVFCNRSFAHKQVKLVPAKAGQQKQIEFEELVEQLPEDILICFNDAIHPTHNTPKSRAWIKKGHQKHIPANLGRKRVNLNGALNALNPCEAVMQ